MKIFIVLAFAFAVALGLIFVPPTMLSDSYAVDMPLYGQTNPRSYVIPGEYIVTLKPESIGEPITGDQGLSNSSLKKQEQNILIQADKAAELIDDQGGNITQIYNRVFNGFAVKGVEDVTPLVQDPAVDSVEPNYIEMPQAQYLPNSINRMDLDRAITASSRPDNREQKPDVDVAVIDQPVNSHHPDLNVVERKNFISGCGSAKTSTGEIIECFNENGYHGTHVAGSIAARDNLGGVVGGLPGARIHSFGVCTVNDGCHRDAVLRAWDYMVSTGQIEIANMSLGGGGISSSLQDAASNLVNSGVTMFVSAGNDRANVDNSAYCGLVAFICVSASADTDGKCGGLGPSFVRGDGNTQRDDVRAWFSSFGSSVDIMAPGVRVLSTWPGELTPGDPATGLPPGTAGSYIGSSGQGNYAVISGTSMSSPTAAGIGALIKFKNPSFTPAQIKSNMLSNAYSQTQGCDGFGKGGLVGGGVDGANGRTSEKMIYAGNY